MYDIKLVAINSDEAKAIAETNTVLALKYEMEGTSAKTTWLTMTMCNARSEGFQLVADLMPNSIHYWKVARHAQLTAQEKSDDV